MFSPGLGVVDRGREAGGGWEGSAGPLCTPLGPAKKRGLVRSRVGRTDRGVLRDEAAPAKCFKARGPQLQVWRRRRNPSVPSLPAPAEPRCAPHRAPRARPPSPPGAASPWGPAGSRPAPEPRVSHLLAVRGRALLPQATPVQQVPCLQVQGAGPRQQRPGRAAVGAHGSGPRRGARRRRGRRRGWRPPHRTRCPRPESRARDWPPHAAGPRPVLGTEGGRMVAERRPGKDALAGAATASAAAAGELIPN